MRRDRKDRRTVVLAMSLCASVMLGACAPAAGEASASSAESMTVQGTVIEEAGTETAAAEAAEPAEAEPFSGKKALAYADAYTDFGNKRTGTEGQIKSAQWIADELEALGVEAELQEIPFRQFELTECSVTVDGKELDSFPYWFPVKTGEEGVSGQLEMYGEGRSYQDKIVVYEVPGMASVSDISGIAAECKEGGAKAVLAAIMHPTGLVNPQNAVKEYYQNELPLPCAIVQKNELEFLAQSVAKGSQAVVVIEGNIHEDAVSSNIVAKIDNGAEQWVVVTTPISGWSSCGGERGPGVGMFLELARLFPEISGQYNYLFVGTTGHELNFLGMHAYEDQFPQPEDTLLWVHLGSGIAAKEAVAEGYKYVGCSEYLTETVRAAFAEDADMTLQADQEKVSQSEVGEVIQKGYTAVGFFGGNQYFHTEADEKGGINEAELEMIGRDTCQLLEQMIANEVPKVEVSVERIGDGPIIYPELDESLTENIQGPSVIRVPEWVEDPLGKYYMYFADHKGDRIKLAYADELKGPWKIYADGAIHLTDTTFFHEPPKLTEEQKAALPDMARKLGFDPDTKLAHDLMEEAVAPHIASPEAVVDHENQKIILYFHGLSGVAVQTTRVSVSDDGVHFEKDLGEDLGTSYLRVFEHDGYVYGMTMPGQLYRSKDGMTNFEKGPKLFFPNIRHHGLWLKDNVLYVFYTKVGDAPEQIYLSCMDISGDWTEWIPSAPAVVMKPEFDWEGQDAPIEPSVRSTAYGHVNQLRDPYIFEDEGKMYIFYAVAGESGIGLAELTITEKQ